jgi:hypothetical protein
VAVAFAEVPERSVTVTTGKKDPAEPGAHERADVFEETHPAGRSEYA